MKEATSGLNMGLVTLIAIGTMVAFFYTVIWPAVKTNYNENTKCDKAVCDIVNLNNNGTVRCEYTDKNGHISYPICVFKG